MNPLRPTRALVLTALCFAFIVINARAQGPATVLTSTSIGSSTTGSVTFSVSASPASVVGTTQGLTGYDFSATAGSCTSASCTFGVKFTPTQPGIRFGAVVAKNSAGATIGYGLVTGVGLAPNGVLYPATQSSLIPNLYSIYNIAIDPAGNIYTADDNSQSYYKFTKSGSTYTRTTIGTSPSQPDGIAVDGAGNVYGADYYGTNGTAGTAYKFTYSNGSYTSNGAVATLPSGAYAGNVSLDTSGNLYMSGGNSSVYKATLQSNGSYSVAAIVTNSAFTQTTGVVPDASGNLYITADDFNIAANNIVAVEKYSGGNYTYQKIATLVNPVALALDAGGNIYVADEGTYTSNAVSFPGAAAYMFTSSSGGYTQSTLPGTYNSVYAIAVDTYGRVLVGNQPGNISSTNNTASTIYLVDPTGSPTFTFANTAVNGNSATQTATLLNTGSSALTLPNPASGQNPSVANNFKQANSSTCPIAYSSSSTPGSVAAGTSCTEILSYSPAISGATSGKLIVTDNSQNVSGSTQSVVLAGSTASTLTMDIDSPLSIPVGTASVTLISIVGWGGNTAPTGTVSFTVNGSSSGVGAVSCILKAGHKNCSATYNSSTLTPKSYPIVATEASDGTYSTTTANGTLTVTSTSSRPIGDPVLSTAPEPVESPQSSLRQAPTAAAPTVSSDPAPPRRGNFVPGRGNPNATRAQAASGQAAETVKPGETKVEQSSPKP